MTSTATFTVKIESKLLFFIPEASDVLIDSHHVSSLSTEEAELSKEDTTITTTAEVSTELVEADAAATAVADAIIDVDAATATNDATTTTVPVAAAAAPLARLGSKRAKLDLLDSMTEETNIDDDVDDQVDAPAVVDASLGGLKEETELVSVVDITAAATHVPTETATTRSSSPTATTATPTATESSAPMINIEKVSASFETDDVAINDLKVENKSKKEKKEKKEDKEKKEKKKSKKKKIFGSDKDSEGELIEEEKEKKKSKKKSKNKVEVRDGWAQTEAKEEEEKAEEEEGSRIVDLPLGGTGDGTIPALVTVKMLKVGCCQREVRHR